MGLEDGSGMAGVEVRTPEVSVADGGDKISGTSENTNKSNKVNIGQVEIPNLTEKESVTTQRAVDIVYKPETKAGSLDEVKGLIGHLEDLNARKYPDDDKYNQGLEVKMREWEWCDAHVHTWIEEGAVDLETGEKTPIEIIDPRDKTSTVIRPTKNELREANDTMSGTARWEIMNMLTYLKDYEAVATGEIDPYLYRNPDILSELLEKSKFTKKGGISSERGGEEIVGGLALTWADTAEYYDSVGSTTAAEEIRSTGRFQTETTEVGDTIIGEKHLRLVNIPEYQENFNTRIDNVQSGDMVVVEHRSDAANNGWTISSPEVRFMQQAEDAARDKPEVGLEVLDDELKENWAVWENSMYDLQITKNEYYFLKGLVDSWKHIFADGGIEKFIKDIKNDGKLSSEDKSAELKGTGKLVQILHKDTESSKSDLKLVQRLRLLYVQLDAVCRERMYQDKISELRRNETGNLFIVVGNAHVEGLKNTLSDSDYRTGFDEKMVGEFKSILNTFYKNLR